MTDFRGRLVCISFVLQWTGKNHWNVIRLSEIPFKIERDGSLLFKTTFAVMDEKNPEVRARIPPKGWIIKDVLGNFEILEDADFRRKYGQVKYLRKKREEESEAEERGGL